MLYLDHNATTPALPEVISVMTEILGKPMNPSSVHGFGREAKAIMENARKDVSSLLGVDLRKDGYNLVFTASGTEANNLVMPLEGKVIVSSIEHPSILRHKDYNNKIDILRVDQNGIVILEELEKWLEQNRVGLVSIMKANNETGVIQPIAEIARITHQYGALLHSDCIQAVGKINVDLIDSGIDFASISAHKFGGPVGVGALIYKDKLALKAQIIGGGQERGFRAGTENVASIAGMGVAAKLSSITPFDNEALRDLFEAKVHTICKDVQVFSQKVARLPNTSMLTMPGISSSRQLIAFDIEGIALSSGSACSSGKVKASNVLRAMGACDKAAGSAIRVSFSNSNTLADVDKLVEVWAKIWKNQ